MHPRFRAFLRRLLAPTLQESVPFDDEDVRVATLEWSEASPTRETKHRSDMRYLMDGAGFAGATVKLAFVRKVGGIRHMVCTPEPCMDATFQYVTVRDHELSAAAGNPVFRRVCLDTILSMEITYRASGAHEE